jgi:2-keto-4-pentenoate hydratase/2-oxohepta-3-ene-1,7-dioic acid hydratase in catechol pathway
VKLVSFECEGAAGFGAVIGDAIALLDGGERAPKDLKSYIAAYAAGVAPAFPDQAKVPLYAIRLLPPIPNPGKVFCVATNFHEPSREDKPAPEYPLLFTRFGDSLTGHEAPILKPSPSDRFDFEGEVAVVIGKPGYRIPEETAMSHVVGYSCFNDGSARDWQKHSSQFTPGKNFYQSGSFGPWLVTVDEIPDPTRLTLETRVNGTVKQSISLDRFIFPIPWLIAYISTFSPLAPGDVIVTGTPWGFGSSRQPPEFLRPGDVVEVEVSGIGILRNTVVNGPSTEFRK